MSVSSLFSPETQGYAPEPLRSRFEVCRSLADGEPAFPLTRVDPLFEEQAVSFGRSVRPMNATGPTDWLVQAIAKLTSDIQSLNMTLRPVHLPMPVSIFTDGNAAEIAQLAVTEAGFCCQEFIVEIQDASLASGESDVFDRLDAFRRKGFRIALDARKSAATPFSSRIRGVIERLRVNATDLIIDDMLQLRADMVTCIGGDVIVDRAGWRQADELRQLGATHALKLLTDA